MGRILKQLLLLVKKNFLLQYRRPIGALVEFLLPCGLLGLIALVRLASPIIPHCFSYFVPFKSTQLHGSQSAASVIAIGPNTDYVRSIASIMEQSQGYLKSYKVVEYSEDEIKTFLKQRSVDANSTVAIKHQLAIIPSVRTFNEIMSQTPEVFRAAVLFNETTDTSNLNYTIRFPQSVAFENDWNTARDYPYYYEPGPFYWRGYNKGFIQLQQVIDRAIMQKSGISTSDIPAMNIRQLPFPSWDQDDFTNATRNSLPLILVVSFLWIAASISKELVEEKSTRMKETMKMMGLKNWILWLSWVIQRLVLMFITVLLVTIILKVARYLIKSSFFVLFLFLFEYTIAVMCYCFFLSTLFSKTTTAIAGTMMGYFSLYIPYFFLGNDFDRLSNQQRYMSCLLASTCMGYGANIISKWETMQEGIQFGNINKQPSDLDTFKMSDVMAMMFLDIILYSLMTWYIEAVFPGDYGIKQKPWFFLTRSYWLGSKPRQSKGDGAEVIEEGNDADFTAHEKGPRGKKVGIAIQGLLKRFQTKNGRITAVNNLSLNMYQDQVTSLLGHNGAGKTTTMSMLTGLYSPNGGDAYVNGHSILYNMDRVRDSLGICPQHNVLFDRLTVMEHLDFFIKLKGYTGDIMAESKKMIKMLQLEDKEDSKCEELSGGMKRKLSVGIALSGDSRVVILDEPTAGMDPYARRATWDLILQNKMERTILLTTHYMDEADFLGDRIAIMASGKLVCSGSSLFLKRKYGVGYHLTLVKGPKCQPESVDEFIRSYIKTASKISDVGSELIYVMPDSETTNFIPLFQKLEDGNLEERVDIESFGLSLTTLEEVFMKVGEAQEEEEEDSGKNSKKQAEIKSKGIKDGRGAKFRVFSRDELNQGAVLLVQQLWAMIVKRCINSVRYKKGYISQIILPVIFTVLGLLVVLYKPYDERGALRKIDLANYPGKDVKGTGFMDDFSTDYFFTDTMLSYLNKQNVKEFKHLKAAAGELKSTFYEQLDFPCCKENSLQLAKNCALKGGDFDKWKSCVGNSSWGYDACYAECLNNKQKLDGEVVEENCTSEHPLPDTKYLDDMLSYWSNAFLHMVKEKDDPRFYRTHHLAFTYSQLPPFVDLISEVSGVKTRDTGTPDYSVVSFSSDVSQNMLTGWISHEALHLAPGVQNALSNMMFIKHGKSTRVSVSNHPLPESLLDRFRFAGFTPDGFSLAIMMLMGFSFLTASFCLFIVEERENKSKHLQQISGVYEVVYWCGTFSWDLINYLICILVVTLFFAIFRVDGYNTLDTILAVFMIMLLYGYGSIPFIYLLSLIFSSPVTAFSLIATFTFLSGLAGFIATLVLAILNKDYKATVDQILLILPNYSLVTGISNIYGNGVIKNLAEECKDLFPDAYCDGTLKAASLYSLDENSIGRQLLACFVVGTVCFVLVNINEIFGKTISMLINSLNQSKSLDSLAAPSGEDDDVRRERTRIACDIQDIAEKEAVVVRNLRKEYGSKVAVQNLTLGIPKNECFGLLGVNGAGKTTTFSMLTGEISKTCGEAYVAGYNLETDIRSIQRKIGYCPQFDALIGIMTGRELLTMFARMRGIPEGSIPETVDEVVDNLDLTAYADSLCGSYSGGNKRKLSTAVALVGNPELLFLDEPTAGMDPTARRFLWNVLSSLTASNIGTSIILTSHSMEECEALCNRLVIMVNGAFRCLGSIQHLKTKYGSGYTVTLVVPEAAQKSCANFITSTFSGAILKESHTGYLQYELDPSIKWSFIFNQMERNKEELQIEDYAVNQTSLEQVFLNFAKEQEENKPKKSRSWFPCLGKPKKPPRKDNNAVTVHYNKAADSVRNKNV